MTNAILNHLETVPMRLRHFNVSAGVDRWARSLLEECAAKSTPQGVARPTGYGWSLTELQAVRGLVRV